MHFFNMKGPWNRWVSLIYDHVVAGGSGELYENLVGFLFNGLPEGCRVLDVGCGSGQVCRCIAGKHPQARVLGIDLSPDQVDRAGKKNRDLENVEFQVGDAMDLQFPAESFHRVLSVASIKHWPDPARGLEQMRRVCKKGGQACVLEVDRNSSWQEARAFVARWRMVLPGTRPLMSAYFHRFVAGQGLDTGEMTSLFRACDFQESHVQKIPDQPFLMGLGIP